MYLGFAKLEKKLAAKGAKNPAGMAASIGRKKYGEKTFSQAAMMGKKGLGGGLKSKGM